MISIFDIFLILVYSQSRMHKLSLLDRTLIIIYIFLLLKYSHLNKYTRYHLSHNPRILLKSPSLIRNMFLFLSFGTRISSFFGNRILKNNWNSFILCSKTHTVTNRDIHYTHIILLWTCFEAVFHRPYINSSH